MNKKIETLFKKNNGFLKAADLYSVGATRSEVSSMLECGDILRIKRGYYQLANMDEPNEAAMIAKLFPEAILCMDTALFHYGYSDRTPLEWNMAVSRGISKSRFNLTYPFIKPYYIDDKYLNIGVVEETIDGVGMKIYDRERAVCDCLKYKNKMDGEMFGKAIQAYLNDPQKNIKNLASYAKQLRVYKKAQDLIGVWL
jgi:predicted transcriptional regulator of viral defense system